MKVAPFAEGSDEPSDAEIMADIESCSEDATELVQLQADDNKAYQKAVLELRSVAHGKKVVGKYANMTVEHADAILMELSEPNAPLSRDEEIDAIKSDDEEPDFMGDSSVFIQIEEAVRTRELVEDSL